MVDQEVAKVIVNKSQYDEPCGPQLETVKYHPMMNKIVVSLPIAINYGHLINTPLEDEEIIEFFKSGGNEAKKMSEFMIRQYNKFVDKGQEHPELSKTPITAYRVFNALSSIGGGFSDEVFQIAKENGLSAVFRSAMTISNIESDCDVKILNKELDEINNMIETSAKKQDSTIKVTEKIEKMKETAVEKLMTEAGLSTEVFTVINSTLQSQLQFDKIFIVPYINALQARYKYLTDVVAKKFTMGIIITPRSKEN